MRPVPTQDEIDALVADGWTVTREGAAIERSFRFANFEEAMGFMTTCAIWAARFDHHPEWSNIYARVDVLLTTHSVGGLSDLDVAFGVKMNEVARPYERPSHNRDLER